MAVDVIRKRINEGAKIRVKSLSLSHYVGAALKDSAFSKSWCFSKIRCRGWF
jgi:hypothetical protein